MKHCPVCNKKISPQDNNKSDPFCSERCRLIDLGDWLTENHKISTENTELEFDETRTDDYIKH